MIVSHEPGIKTVFKPNPNWWGKVEHNLTEVVFQTIKSDATRVAALLSGDIDMMDPVPVQDVERVKSSPNARVLTGPELRTIFLQHGLVPRRAALLQREGQEPLQGRRACARPSIRPSTWMRSTPRSCAGMSANSAILISPLLFARAGEFKRWPYDVAAAKKLLAEAGYPNGFEVEMDCPNDRYVNDEAICQAVTQMQARIGIKVKLNAMPKAKYFEKAGVASKFNSSFNLLGWTPGSFDSWNVIANILGCRDADGKGGLFNYGGYCNPKIDGAQRQDPGRDRHRQARCHDRRGLPASTTRRPA